ncbi:Zn-dependent dipeptidase, microsomal dipeptidase [Galbibacter orientalis DSM 19592]|uniref:Zn-dependent dipeptidase, microsomal dipeptidase n=1 Tax=Galbibacter orientalis DSM 19592 TaxID=926559 RepID=I3C4W0_9FLAO|nr:membrane dipeptidase [Galbibacter orientalis]EIJ38653.1 Zn-dependent dipeptidase, microsomal dipeptidase [Galbibacter orientalis DSM 19592]
MFILDAHLDLSMNAIDWNRDLRWTVEEIRAYEKGMTDLPGRSANTVSLDAMRKGNVGVCVATQIARYVKKDNPLPGWNSPQQAWAQTQAQLAWYLEMEALGEMKQIRNVNELDSHLEYWNHSDDCNKAIGFILSLEGADSIVSMEHLHKAHAYGLRAIGPAHYGPGTYAFGTDSVGGIGEKGKELLREIEKLNLILDATHLCDQSFWEALDVYNGAIWASHNNCRTLVNHNRQFSDEQIKELLKRNAVIGVVMDAWMMVPNWVRGKSTPKSMDASLKQVVDNIDHICQLAGNTSQVGIGSDLDGGFGLEQSPHDIDTIADLQKIPELLKARGYSEKDIQGIMHGNFLKFIRRVWRG